VAARVVDASVWVSAADAAEKLSAPSRTFLHAIMRQRDRIALPAIARLEVACALSRRLRDARQGRDLADRLLLSPLIAEIDLGSLLGTALTVGTESFLRAGNAFHAAVATDEDRLIISGDEELLRRANAVTPSAWLTEREQA
jgi:predicted nucleic acid-binding protein